MESYNEKLINGDLTILTTEEIRHRVYGYFVTQGRAVTVQDYISAAYAMPANLEQKRASISRDDNDLTRNMNMSLFPKIKMAIYKSRARPLKKI